MAVSRSARTVFGRERHLRRSSLALAGGSLPSPADGPTLEIPDPLFFQGHSGETEDTDIIPRGRSPRVILMAIAAAAITIAALVALAFPGGARPSRPAAPPVTLHVPAAAPTIVSLPAVMPSVPPAAAPLPVTPPTPSVAPGDSTSPVRSRSRRTRLRTFRADPDGPLPLNF